MPRIALCMIVKDGAETLGRCLASAAPHVHEINVLDTGSSDATIELVEQEAAKLAGSVTVRLVRGAWHDDFARAREESFGLASSAAEWLLWLDADDELVVDGRLEDIVEKVPRSTGAVAAYYECAHDAVGRVIEGVWRLRVVRASAGYGWHGVVHEGLVAKGDAVAVAAVPPSRLRVVHRPTHGTSHIDRNLAILLRAKEQADAGRKPLDSRLLLSLGLELTACGRFDEALEALASYVERDADGWSDERAHATAQCGVCLRALGRVEHARDVETEAFRARPDWTELPLGLAETDALDRRWPEAARWAEAAAELPLPRTAVRLDPRWLELGPLLRLAEARLELRDLDGVVASLRALRSRVSGDANLLAAVETAEAAAERDDAHACLLLVREAAGRYHPTTRAVARGLLLASADHSTP